MSSHPNVLTILDSKVSIPGGETEYIRVKMPKKEKAGLAEVMVFVSDEDDKISFGATEIKKGVTRRE